MRIDSFGDFYREMLARANPQQRKRTSLRAACDLMWHDGELRPTYIQRHAGVTQPTASKWCTIARSMGMKQGVKRHVIQANVDRVVEEVHSNLAAEPLVMPERKIEEEILKKAPSADELRQEMIDKVYNDARMATSPETRFRAIETMAKIIPGFKAPETRLDVQMLIGKGASDRLTDDLKDNLKFLVKEDPNWVKSLLSDLDTEPLQLEATDAETEDTPVDDGPSRDEPQQRAE